MTPTYTAYYRSPIGLLAISASETAIKIIKFVETEPPDLSQPDPLPPLLADCLAQLAGYFSGERREFSLPLEPDGTTFQQAVWRCLTELPYGQTVSYQQVARALHNEQAVRAVGAANGRNPIVIIVPCHRVIGSDGRLTGYGGGLWRKEWLLKHEGALAQPALFSSL